MHDVLFPKRMCSETRHLFQLMEINDNISLAVQDRDTVAM